MRNRASSTHHQRLFTIPVGSDGVTYQDPSQTEMQRVGPAAFTVAPDGTFWIVDTVGQRVLHYRPTGQQLGLIDLGDATRALVDIAATPAEVFVLDAFPTPALVLRLAPDGTRCGQYQLPEGFSVNDGLSGIALTDTGVLLGEFMLGQVIVQLLDDSGHVHPTPLPGYIHRGMVYTVKAADFNTPGDHTYGTITAGKRMIVVDTVNDLGGLALTGFAPDDSFYAELQELGPGVPVQVDQTIRHYAADGTLRGLARFPLAAQYTYVGQAMVVGPDGAVYAMVTRPVGVEIWRMRFARKLKPILPPPGTSG